MITSKQKNYDINNIIILLIYITCFIHSSNKDLYETSKLSNFLTLIIMIIIILTVYKSCTKNRENDLLRRELGSYAHIIESTDSNFNTNSNLFPPPPPPYGYDNASNNPTSSIPNETNESHSTQQQPQNC